MSALDVDLSIARPTRRGAGFALEARHAFAAGITTISGASGSGKSSLLLAVLGALRPTRGSLRLDGRVLFDGAAGVDLPVRARRIGMVFQDASLFPHLDALENVRFAARGDAPAARRWLEHVGAGELARRLPEELSGGQRQRVALARSLAAEPSALLLDEPFSSLDRGARGALNALLVELCRERPLPYLYVTHDPVDALQLGGEALHLANGELARAARPEDDPAADENLFRARVVRHDGRAGVSEIDLAGTTWRCPPVAAVPGAFAVFSLRPEDPIVAVAPPGATSARNVVRGRVRAIRERGEALELIVETPYPLRVLVTPSAIAELDLAVGRDVYLLVKASALRPFPASSSS